MKKFSFKETEPMNRQIHISPTCLRDTFLFCIGALFAAALVQEDRWIYIVAALFGLCYGVLTFCNDRVTYDETGITLYSILGKPFHKNWSEVLTVSVVEEPLVSKRFLLDHVLKVQCAEKNNTILTTYRFPYRYYLGIDDFLSFFTTYISKPSDSPDENNS